MHALQLVYVWLRSVNNEGHFTWRTQYFLHCISPSISWIFLKLHIFHSLRMCYVCYKFVCDRSILKGTFLEEHSISPLYLTFYCMDLSETPYLSLIAHALQLVLFWLQSVNNEGHFTCRTITFYTASCPPFHESFWISTPITHCPCAIIGISLAVNGTNRCSEHVKVNLSLHVL